jgi:thiol-disulfide isomerase/thioredoxin
MEKTLSKLLIGRILILLLSVLPFFLDSTPAQSQSVPCVGSHIPKFQLLVPENEEDKQYLGIVTSQTFSIDQVDGQVVLVEIMGVYCPRCHLQAPLFNQLFQKIRKNPDMDGKIKFVAIAAGATSMEVEFMRKQHGIPFPLFEDPNFEIHQLLGQPRTPFAMLISSQEKVLYAHLGIIDDLDSLLQEIEQSIR